MRKLVLVLLLLCSGLAFGCAGLSDQSANAHVKMAFTLSPENKAPETALADGGVITNLANAVGSVAWPVAAAMEPWSVLAYSVSEVGNFGTLASQTASKNDTLVIDAVGQSVSVEWQDGDGVNGPMKSLVPKTVTVIQDGENSTANE